MKYISFILGMLLAFCCTCGIAEEKKPTADICPIGAPWTCMVQGNNLYVYTTTTKPYQIYAPEIHGKEMSDPWKDDSEKKADEWHRTIFWLGKNVDLSKKVEQQKPNAWEILLADSSLLPIVPQIDVASTEKDNKILLMREGKGSGAGYKHLEYEWFPCQFTDETKTRYVQYTSIKGIIVEGENRGKVFDADLSEPSVCVSQNSVLLSSTRDKKEIWVAELPSDKKDTGEEDIPAVILGKGRTPKLLNDGKRFLCFAITPVEQSDLHPELFVGSLVCWESKDGKKWFETKWKLNKDNIAQLDACVVSDGKTVLAICDKDTGNLALYLIDEKGLHLIPTPDNEIITAKNPRIHLHDRELVLFSEEKREGNQMIVWRELLPIDKIIKSPEEK